MTEYKTIERESQAEFRDRGSRFIAYAFPVKTTDAFRERLRALREEHPKAAHHCFAWRLGTSHDQFRSSDDGEPSGSAGKPILGQLDSRELTDTAIVVVRYFGGTLLGVPGLIHAYRTAASLALQLTPVVTKPVLVPCRLQFDYSLMNEVMMVVKRFGCIILNQEMQLFCYLEIGIPMKNQDACLDKLRHLHGVDIQK